MRTQDTLVTSPLSETRHTRESLLQALRHQVDHPATEIAVATLCAGEIEPTVLAVLDEACAADLDLASGRLLFRGLHILGGRRLSRGFPSLLTFLRGPQSRVDDFLGDAVTETLTRILAGMFDGNFEALCGLITDLNADSFVRDAAMGALVFLTFDRRIDPALAREFLIRFDTERLAPPDDAIAWHAWMTAVALLGLRDFSPRIDAAFQDGRISPEFADESDFDKLLSEAIERPDDATRFENENLGYIEDVLVALQRFAYADDDGRTRAEPDLSPSWPSLGDRLPARNPWRNVGRNDPCPCGSGKKFKKCCRPAT